MSGLEAVRGSLERDPRDGDPPGRRDPFTVDVCNALEALAATWGRDWDIAYANGQWRAQRRDRTGLVLTCETPDELVRAMRGHGGTR